MRLVILLGVGLLIQPAVAQGAPLDRLYGCADMSDATQRLACFDAAVVALKDAEASGGVAVVNRSQIEQAEKEAFGLAMPSLSEVAANVRASSSSASAAAQPPKPLDEVSLAVRSVEKGPDGKVRFTMENGQVWRQTDERVLAPIGKGPWTAVVRKAALGSFMLKLNNLPAVRAKRVE